MPTVQIEARSYELTPSVSVSQAIDCIELSLRHRRQALAWALVLTCPKLAKLAKVPPGLEPYAAGTAALDGLIRAGARLPAITSAGAVALDVVLLDQVRPHLPTAPVDEEDGEPGPSPTAIALGNSDGPPST